MIEIAKYYNVDYEPDPQVMAGDEAYAADALIELGPGPAAPGKADFAPDAQQQILPPGVRPPGPPGGAGGAGGAAAAMPPPSQPFQYPQQQQQGQQPFQGGEDQSLDALAFQGC